MPLPPVHMCPGMHTPRYEGTPPVVDAPNAIKIGNPTSQCALLGLKLVQLGTLAGRIFFCHQGKSSDGVGTDYIRSEGAYKLRISSVRTPSKLCPP